MGGSVQRESLIAQIEQRLEESGINAVVEESDGVITVSGVVASAEARQAAEDIVAAVAPNRRIDYSLEVETVLPVDVGDFDADEPSAELAETTAEIREQGGEMEPDFTDQSMLEDPTAASGPSSSSGAEDVVEAGDDVYVPPTDPVVTSDEQDQTQVLGGFQSTSMDSMEPEPSTLDPGIGDEALADAIRLELREDAATTDLTISVLVRQGVAHLRGVVASMEDAESAEEVASRVPGVREVVEELEVRSG
jgi:osmotically-inducible protein OsmY